ncbi:MAG: L-threonylcarbamoyladenylate synthase [Myxococcota bacterium]
MNLDLEPYVAILRRGGVVGCPTETQFGLLADALNESAVARVATLKGRASTAPIAVLLPSLEHLPQVAQGISEAARTLAQRYWPGPLTLVVSAKSGLPAPLVSDQGGIGVRVPGASVALDLVQRFGRPLTATSANRSGAPAAHTAEELAASLGHVLDAIVDGTSGGESPSTVVDCLGEVLKVIRPGPVTIKEAAF